MGAIAVTLLGHFHASNSNLLILISYLIQTAHSFSIFLLLEMFDVYFIFETERRRDNYSQRQEWTKNQEDMATWRNGGAPQVCHVVMSRETETYHMGSSC